MNSNKSTIFLTPTHACESKKERTIGGMWQGLEWQARSIDYHWGNKLKHSIQVFFSKKKVVGVGDLGVINFFSF
jgi:hypothetical protein